MTEPAMVLMTASAIVAAVCCLRAGRTVPWQGRQCVIVMAIVMVALGGAGSHTGADPGAALIAGTVLVGSAMLGTMGLRGRRSVRDCCHRALGSLVMGVCAFAGAVHGGDAAGGSTSPVSVHPGHGAQLASDPLTVLATAGVMLLLGWTVYDRLRPHERRGASRLLAVESWAMTAGVAVMWAAH